tara:strand:- start:3977 stop:4279 length:303 start_codon:yes stop_codon:yes gene_type:complete
MAEVLAGTFSIAVAVLSIIAGIIALHTFKLVHGENRLKPWKVLMVMLVLFVIEELLGALKFFGIYEHPFITHIIPTAILGLLIYALLLEIILVKTQNDNQ